MDAAANPWVLRDGLIDYLQSQKGITDTDAYLEAGVDIEEIHSEIASKLASVEKEIGSYDRIVLSKPYNQLIFLFATTLNEIANGPISQSHIDLANSLQPEDVVLTFNWDTLMDRALMSATDWVPDSGYGIAPHRIFRDGWVIPDVKSSSNKIIKLHGSVNWLTAHPIYEGEELVLTHGLPADSLFVYEHATRPYATHAGRYADGYAPMTYGYYPPNLTDVPGRSAPEGYAIVKVQPKMPWMPEGQAGKQGLPSMPLIIPPVKEKSYQFFGGLFEKLWRKASEALEICDEVLVIGYSFPKTDLKSLDLFRDAFLRRVSVPRVTIIDPNPKRPKEVFQLDLGIPESHLRVVASPFLGAETIDPLFGN
ncbi:hypothetical protein JCM7686_0291 [Paracoccus aminophilus JCM 7686]|uniref:SIR2-like domain-containing protein n=1 Tax=Paracoccus aminophilus JCM 7686 TaxID=1367847 RepID=S5XQQ8_PARAH|nr:hypothetical protein JCM7686_0291 [Paracoccus aminophilus JCM 7686]